MSEEGASEHDRPEERVCGAFVGEEEEEEWGEGVGTGLTGGGAGPAVGGEAIEVDLLRH